MILGDRIRGLGGIIRVLGPELGGKTRGPALLYRGLSKSGIPKYIYYVQDTKSGISKCTYIVM
jgi:hypothetical protein